VVGRRADVKAADAKQHGLDARGVAQTARAAWGKAIAAFEEAERLESAWGACTGGSGAVTGPPRADAATDFAGFDFEPCRRSKSATRPDPRIGFMSAN
jgi:hypothetical protein